LKGKELLLRGVTWKMNPQVHETYRQQAEAARRQPKPVNGPKLPVVTERFPGDAMSMLANLLVYPRGGTLAP